MKMEELLERYEEEIVKNKLKFSGYGPHYERIRDIFNFKPLKKDEKKAFIGICDIRIDRLKTLSKNVITNMGILVVLIAMIINFCIITLVDTDLFSVLLLLFILIIILFVLLLIVLRHLTAQTLAWYAIKEGALLYEE